MEQREKRAAEHQRASAGLAQLSIAIKLGPEGGEFISPCVLALRDRVAVSDQERATERVWKALQANGF